MPRPSVDPAMLVPCAEPERPPASATQRDVALLIEDFREALAACNADKAALKRILE